ncbi:hypothetical protein QBC32DRAFT_123498 [Pseudoneurospora amorphoporcata]|uniref:Fibroin-3 n=1 Tax=Pseudoneurospora amorphoporcata TaxID=241081 RepID=A0AAN6NYA3_9PEZI|nr:hypothetical protein QBC32DRAFT_123498 [Pseudoneurospora amorphoporcata]
MPTIDVAMRRSVQRGIVDGFVNLLVRSVQPALEERNVVQDFNDAKTAFSSWDNCMQVDYCKWTAIGLMIFAGLVIFSICWCIGRCLCCGLSCCCECFRCLACCGNCCGCCDPPGSRKHKYLDAPFVPPDQGYKAPEPMDQGFGSRPAPSYSEPSYNSNSKASEPQYAVFEVNKKRQTMGDSLPAMPEWEGAGSKKVLVEEEAVELDQLKKPEETTAQGAGAGAGAAVMSGAAAAIPAAGPGRGTTPRPSPPPGGQQSPYGVPAGNHGLYGNNGGYGQNAQGYNQVPLASPYGQSSSPSPYGMAASAMGPAAVGNAGYNAPGGGYGNQQQDAYGRYGEPTRNNTYDSYGTSNVPTSPYDTSPYDNYDTGDQGGYGSSQQQQPYGMAAGGVAAGMGMAAGSMGGPNRVRSPPAAMNSTPYPQNPMTRRSPGPEQQLNGLGYGGGSSGNGNHQAYEMAGDDSFLGGPRHNSPAPQSTGVTGGGGGGYDSFSNQQSSYSQGSQRQNTFGGNNNIRGGGNGYGGGNNAAASYGDIMRSTPSPAPTGPLPKPPVRKNTMGMSVGTMNSGGGGGAGAGGGGFDFTSEGYSRPELQGMGQQQGGGGGIGGMGGQNDGGAAAYPGYKPYTPVGGGAGGPGGGAAGGVYRGW